MKVLLFYVNKDEMDYINTCNRKFQFELVIADYDFQSTKTEDFLGFDAVWITTNCKITKEKTYELKKAGVKYLVSRAAGTDHMDIQAMKEAGLKVANVPKYSPNAIAEHTVCLVLMSLRKMKRELKMVEDYNFTLSGIKGRELRNMTVGVIGTGRIGAETIKSLSGFGCKILAYDLYENSEVENIVNYMSLKEVMIRSNILILHCPLTSENEKLINSETISLMKDGAVLINTARGGLMDYEAVLSAIESGKLSAAAFDVYDRETSYIRKKVDGNRFEDKTLKNLIENDNVIYTAHMSFYTDTAIENMIMTTFENLYEYDATNHCSNDLID